MPSKFNPGDRVRVINYGHPYWESMEGKFQFFDMSPELVGHEGVVKGSYTHLYGGSSPRHDSQYSLEGIPGKCAWYDEGQLELVL